MPHARLSLPPPVKLFPKLLYGMRLNCYGRVHYTRSRQIVYPVEKFLVFQFTRRRRIRQRFMRFPDGTEPLYITMDAEKTMMIILEKFGEYDGHINIYNTVTHKVIRRIEMPEEIQCTDILHIQLSYNNRYLVILNKPPEQRIFMITLDSHLTVVSGEIESGKATNFACNPEDFNLIVVCGYEECFLMSKMGRELQISFRIKCGGFNFLSCSFLGSDLIVLGTDNNQLVLAETGEIKFAMRANVATDIDTLWDQETLDEIWSDKILHEYDLSHFEVNFIRPCKRGFLFTIANKVIVFDRVSKYAFERNTVHTIPYTYYDPDSYQIQFVDIDLDEKNLMVLTKHAQIYTTPIVIKDIPSDKHNEMRTCGQLIHTDSIIDMAICAWKTIVFTASRDKTVRIWNYDSGEMELVFKYQGDVTIVELSPSGFLAIVGFDDQLQLVQIFLDELNTIKTFCYRHCKCVRFGARGHFLAIAHESNIALINMKTLKILRMLKGHSGHVLTLEWTKEDEFLLSAGDEGAVYVWDTHKAERLMEFVEKGKVYPIVASTWSNEPLKVYAGTTTGLVREFLNENVSREFYPSKKRLPITGIAMAHSDLMMFISNDIGELMNVQLPFNEIGGGMITHQNFFTGRINKMLFSYENTMLFVVTETGTFAIFAIENTKDKLVPIERDMLRCQEVLIPRYKFEEQVETIAALELRLKQQVSEFEYQISQNAIFDGQHLANVHKAHCDALTDLKNLNNDLEAIHVNSINDLVGVMKAKKERHSARVRELLAFMKDRTVSEYNKMVILRTAISNMSKTHERILRKCASALQDTVEALETYYKRDQEMRTELMRELMLEVLDQKAEFLGSCRQSQEDAEYMAEKLECTVGNQIRECRDESTYYRGLLELTCCQHHTVFEQVRENIGEFELVDGELKKKRAILKKLTTIMEEEVRDLADRDYIVNTKDAKILELMSENQILDKSKSVLSHVVAQLKAKIEPIETKLEKYSKRIREIERGVAVISKKNLIVEVKVDNEREKYFEKVDRLRERAVVSRKAREEHHKIIRDIYKMSQYACEYEKLKETMQHLFESYANSFRLKYQLTLDELVEGEFLKQRGYVTQAADQWRERKDVRSVDAKYYRLKSNKKLIVHELKALRKENLRLKEMYDWKLENKKNKKTKKRQKDFDTASGQIERQLGGGEEESEQQVLQNISPKVEAESCEQTPEHRQEASDYVFDPKSLKGKTNVSVHTINLEFSEC